jgi:hypothetical protein
MELPEPKFLTPPKWALLTRPSIRDVCGLHMTKELSFTRYKGHEQATAIANTKAAYPWMNALKAKAALDKAVSGYKHEATH